MTGDDLPELSAVIVSWNCRELLGDCLARLRAHAPARLQMVVVDNGSKDGTIEMIRSRYPEVDLISNPDNAGYTRATNQGIAVSRGERLLLINADALVDASLGSLLEFFDSRPSAGAVGPRLAYPDGDWQRWTAGRHPGLGSALCHYLFLDRLPWAGPAIGLYLSRDVQMAFQPDWVSSACMLVRASAVRAVGLMDEELFAYMDDVDLCFRLKAAGWEVWYCPQSTVTHLMGRDDNRWRASPAALTSFNHYFAARHGRLADFAMRAIEFAGFSLRVLLYGAAGLFRKHDPRLRAMARAHWTHAKLSLQP